MRKINKSFYEWCVEENKYELIEEWYTPINGLTPQEVSYGTNKKFWWRCSEGHLWDALLSNRRKGIGCPMCAGYYPIKGKTDFETLYPELAKEWDYEKNDSIPSEHTGRSNDNIWWICGLGHSYQASIANRTKKSEKGTACPYCANQKVWIGFNDFATFRPELLSEWNYEKNGSMKPTDFTKTSGKIVWWKCKKGHEWQTAINNRVAGNGCFYCNPVATSYSEQYIYYNIKQLFSEAKNRYRIFDYEFDIYIDEIKLAIEYDGLFYHQNTEKSIEKEARKNNFAKEKNIRLIRIKEVQEKIEPYMDNDVIYFKYTANDKQLFRVVEIIIEYINELFMFSLKMEWDKDIHYKVLESIEEYNSEKCLLTKNPELAKEFHPTKNGKLNPSGIFANSNKKIWWLCSKCGYEWESKVSGRNKGIGCPACSNRIVWIGHNDLETVSPELLVDWDYEKNEIKPSHITSGYAKKIYWKCHLCGYEWKISPGARVSKNSGCAMCAKERKNKKVKQIDAISGEEIKTYNSIKEVVNETGYSRTMISDCCNGKRESYDGYMWKFG